MAGKNLRRAAPTRRARWLAVVAALLAVCMTGCVAPPIWIPSEQTRPAETLPTTLTTDADEPLTTEARDADGAPVLSFDRETGTLRIVGAGGYERLDLTAANDAKTVEVEDDGYQLTLSVSAVSAALQQEAYYKPGVEGVRLSDLLPYFLYCLDGSTSTIKLFIAAHAPNGEVIAQTEKPVKYIVNYGYGYKNGPDQIELKLGKQFNWHSYVYTLGLMNVKAKNWQHLGFAYLVEMCVDPFSYGMMGQAESIQNREYFYYEAYYRAGGSGRLGDPMERRLLLDANSWYNLVYGRDWPGSDTERGAMHEIDFFSGDMRKEGNDMSLSMAASLLNYLADRCGIDRVEAYCFDTCSFEEAFDMDFSAARAAWEQSLLDRFGDGSEPPTSLAAPG